MENGRSKPHLGHVIAGIHSTTLGVNATHLPLIVTKKVKVNLGQDLLLGEIYSSLCTTPGVILFCIIRVTTR